jgi:hypothetical protein
MYLYPTLQLHYRYITVTLQIAIPWRDSDGKEAGKKSSPDGDKVFIQIGRPASVAPVGKCNAQIMSDFNDWG